MGKGGATKVNVREQGHKLYGSLWEGVVYSFHCCLSFFTFFFPSFCFFVLVLSLSFFFIWGEVPPPCIYPTECEQWLDYTTDSCIYLLIFLSAVCKALTVGRSPGFSAQHRFIRSLITGVHAASGTDGRNGG